MIKKHLLFTIYQIKSCLKSLPKLVLCMAVFAVLVVAIGFCGTRFSKDSDSGMVSINAGIVLPQNDPDIALCYQLLVSMDSIKNSCNFIPMTAEEGREKLLSGEISALVELPDGFVNSLMNGENTPAIITIPENAGIESIFFCSLIDAGAHTLSNCESGIYAITDLYEEYGFDSYVTDAQDELFDYYYSYAINRTKFFLGKSITETGEVTKLDYYICSGMILLLLLCLMAMIGNFSARSNAQSTALKMHRISTGYIKLSEIIGVALMFFVMFGLIFTVLGIALPDHFSLMPVSYLSLFLLVFSATCFVMFICSLTDSGLIGSLVIFFLTAFMMYAGGRIVAGAFLPEAVEKLGTYLPVTSWSNLCYSSINGHFDGSAALISGGYGLAFIVLGIFFTWIRKRSTR